MPFDASLINRFRSFYAEGDLEVCWGWEGAATPRGRGHFGIGDTTYYAPRIAYALHHGSDPHPYHVCHTCDNPRCVNPKHLWLGTHADNMRDRWAKGKGMTQGRRKVWQKDVEGIKRLRAEGVPWRAISARFGIGLTTIRRALKGPYPWETSTYEQSDSQ